MPKINKDVTCFTVSEPQDYSHPYWYTVVFRHEEQKYYIEQEYQEDIEVDKKMANLITRLMRISKEAGKREVQDAMRQALGLDD